MKIPSVLLITAAAAALSAAPAQAQNMSGEWEIRSQGRGGPMTQILTVQQEGSELTGTIRFEGGGPGGRGGGGEIEITGGRVDGSSFSFTVSLEIGGRGSISTTYTGAYEGDFMEGTIEGPRGGGQPFMGTRPD